MKLLALPAARPLLALPAAPRRLALPAAPIPLGPARANVDRVITLNCGLGRDSLTLVALAAAGELEVEGLGTIGLADIDAVVFSDTGCEWPHTYALIPAVQRLVEEAGGRFVILRHGEGDREGPKPATWADVERRARSGAYHLRPDIIDDYASRRTVVSIGKGDCTTHQKILPIRRFIEDISFARFGLGNRAYGHAVRKGRRRPHVTIIGIAADEAGRVKPNAPHPSYVTEAYPLIEAGITKAHEGQYLERVGLGHVRKSGCWMCPYQPNGWWWALSVTEPDLFQRAVEYEARSLERNPKMSVRGRVRRGEAVRLPEVVAGWRRRNPDATVEAVLAKEYLRGPRNSKQVSLPLASEAA